MGKVFALTAGITGWQASSRISSNVRFGNTPKPLSEEEPPPPPAPAVKASTRGLQRRINRHLPKLYAAFRAMEAAAAQSARADADGTSLTQAHKAWQDAYGRYVYTPIMTHPSLNRYFKTVIFNVTHNNAHEDDILQESLVNGYRYFHKFYGQNPETGPFFSWLVGITRRVALNFVQRTPYGNHTIREKPAYSLDAPVTHGPDTPAWLDQLRTLRPLAHAIEDTGAGGTRAVEDSDSETLLVRQLEQALNRKQFALVRGVVWDELTLTGYARLHGETDKAVYSQWDRVKKKLAGVLEQYAGLQPAGYITPASEHEKRKSRNATEHEGDSTLAV